MSQQSSSGGIGFVGLLTILFVALKLTGYIAWSWWWVLSPIWITALVMVLLASVTILLIYRAEARKKRRDAERIREWRERRSG